MIGKYNRGHSKNTILPKILTIIFLFLFVFVNCLQSNIIFAKQIKGNSEEISEAAGDTIETITSYHINETTSIKNDFYYLGLERMIYKHLDDILRSELVTMLYLNSSLYLYMAMPEDTDYQVSYIVIDKQKYENDMRLLDTDNNYRKYVFPNFEENPTGEYHITEIGFEHPDGKKICYSTERTCKMGMRDGQYYFEQDSINSIVLVGMLLESIYQFENEDGTIQDAWHNRWNNLNAKDHDQRSFYYFAFNCYDRQIDEYFTPDKITEIVVDYTINQYTYTGKKSEYHKASLTKSEHNIQIITPEVIHVEAHDRWNSNNNPYEYNTIYKVNDAEITDNDKAANYNTLYTAQQKGFEWVVHFGETEGYRFADNVTNNKREVDYTKVEDFTTVSMKYKYKGKSYSVQTDTLVNTEVVTRQEADHTESISEQTLNKIHQSVESSAAFIGSTLSHVTDFTRDIAKGFWRTLSLPLRILLIIGVIIAVGIAADWIIKIVNAVRKTKNPIFTLNPKDIQEVIKSEKIDELEDNDD